MNRIFANRNKFPITGLKLQKNSEDGILLD